HPATFGIFGTLEQCQARAIELAHLGVTDLRCILPNTPDVHDAIAQLTAIVVGTIGVLAPPSPRPKAPDPPPGWGGRHGKIFAVAIRGDRALTIYRVGNTD